MISFSEGSLRWQKRRSACPIGCLFPLGYDADRKYPLVLWLHGPTGRGSDNVKQLTKTERTGHAFLDFRRNVQQKFPAFVLVPQCPTGQIWADPEFNLPSKWLVMTMQALAKVEKNYSIDPDRVYVAGQSMGGSGVWAVLQNYPAKWAAAIVMSAYDTFPISRRDRPNSIVGISGRRRPVRPGGDRPVDDGRTKKTPRQSSLHRIPQSGSCGLEQGFHRTRLTFLALRPEAESAPGGSQVGSGAVAASR